MARERQADLDNADEGPSEVRPGMGAAIRLYFRTISYSVPAFVIITILSLISIFFLGIVGVATWLGFQYVHKYVGIAISVVTILPLIFLWWPYADRKMFRVTAGHVAITTELIAAGKTQAESTSLFKYGQQVIAERFGQSESFYGFHDQLRSIFRHLLSTLDRIDDELPLAATLKKYVRIIEGLLVRHLETMVLSYTIAAGAQGEEELDHASMRGTCYIMQNGLTLLKTAVFVAILERIVGAISWFVWSILLFAGIFLGAYTLVFHLPIPDLHQLTLKTLTPMLGNMGVWISLCAALIAAPLLGYLITWAFMTAVLRPITTAMMLLKFHMLVSTQPLKEEWQERISAGAFALDRLDWLSFRMLTANAGGDD
jgi:hypothetical protein